jgi:hypothetical protein
MRFYAFFFLGCAATVVASLVYLSRVLMGF